MNHIKDGTFKLVIMDAQNTFEIEVVENNCIIPLTIIMNEAAGEKKYDV